jgi:Fe-S-cluster containining protein
MSFFPLPSLDGALCEPVRVREGARYACFGDGLCCTDIHAIGPIRLSERARLRVLHDGIVAHDPRDDVHVLVMRAGSGTCIFLEEGRCAVHEPLGGLLKPLACKQFPISLTATPEGGRVTTEHKCPCRTLGERPVLTVADALPAVTQRGEARPGGARGSQGAHRGRRDAALRGVPRAGARAHDRRRARRRVWPTIRLALHPVAFPPLQKGSWPALARQLRGLSGQTRLEHVMRLLAERDPGALRARGRTARRARRPGAAPPPWRDAFERGTARSTAAQEPLAMLADFVLDQVWAMHWIDEFPFANFRAELATRVQLFETVQAWLVADGLRPDQAAAEAILVIELGGGTDWWQDIAREVMLFP